MDASAIAAVSMQMSMNKVQNSVSVSMMKKAMDMTEVSGDMLLRGLETANPTSPPGQLLNVLA
ncbi:MAG: YjfB family protein [Oscillospiraceae bacterium]